MWLGTAGKVDEVPVADVRRFEQEFLEHLRASRKDLMQSIADGQWDDDITGQLDQAVTEFAQSFQTTGSAETTDVAPSGEGQ